MKKPYTLDYSIERDVDRCAAIYDILDTLNKDPSSTDLEQMASYILYGKDENGLNAVKRGEITDNNKRYNSFKKKDDTNESLDALLDNPLVDQNSMKPVEEEKYIYLRKKPSIRRPKYDKKTGALIDPGDSEVPGMRELWERIDYIEKVIAANEGKIPMSEDYTVLKDPYRLYQLKHQLIDMRRHQYYLKDSWQPTIHLLGITPPQPQTYNWDEDSFYWTSLDNWNRKTSAALVHTISKNLEDYETRTNAAGETEVKWVIRRHTFDWENPAHVRALMDYYSALYMQMWDKVYSWGRTLIFDFDRYQDLADLSPVRRYLLTRRIDKASCATIAAELQEKFGLTYNENHVSSIICNEIPEKIAIAAKKQRLLQDTPISQRKQCFRCKKWFPRDAIFFGINHGRKDGWASNCKDCERLRRIEKGGQAAYDMRSKDPQVLEMQTRKT